MFYILLCFQEERCGADVMQRIRTVTAGRVEVGPGTLYSLLERFVTEGLIRETSTQGRRRRYVITEKGRSMLEREYLRLTTLVEDYRRLMPENGGEQP